MQGGNFAAPGSLLSAETSDTESYGSLLLRCTNSHGAVANNAAWHLVGDLGTGEK